MSCICPQRGTAGEGQKQHSGDTPLQDFLAAQAGISPGITSVIIPCAFSFAASCSWELEPGLRWISLISPANASNGSKSPVLVWELQCRTALPQSCPRARQGFTRKSQTAPSWQLCTTLHPAVPHSPTSRVILRATFISLPVPQSWEMPG